MNPKCLADHESDQRIPMIDLRPYTARGFGEAVDRAIANVGVQGIDRQQALEMVRLCPETEPILYGPDFSPTEIRYGKGSRPYLEKIVEPWLNRSPRHQADLAMGWTYEHVPHPHQAGDIPKDRGASEEDIITSGSGWCNEQSRVFMALCQTMNIPTRVCFLVHANSRCGHTASEVFLDGRWVFFDVTFRVTVELSTGELAEGRDLSGKYRHLAHQSYRPRLEDYYSCALPFVEQEPGWRSSDRPQVERGGDLLNAIGISNYVIDGALAVG